jgi:IS605 OrfB family transposase
MKLTVKVKLQPTDEQRAALLQTLEKANVACNFVSEQAWASRTFGTFRLQKLVYADVRARFDLTAQMVVRLVAKVADAYRLDKETQRSFRKHGAIAYDNRILRWYTDKQRVSIWSVSGRLNIPYQAGERQRDLLRYQKGESDLVYQNGTFYLLATCEIPDPDEQETTLALGVDMGIVNLAVDSDANFYSGEAIEKTRQRMHKTRRRLQKCGTKSAKRRLKRLSGKQARFQKDTNHCIAKRIVANATRTKRAVAIEDLAGIRERTRAIRREQRGRHSNWNFGSLRDMIEYKAKMAGTPVRVVAPAYTSQRCLACGHIERANRRSQSQFLCCACGFSEHADVVGATNISVWATVISPHGATFGQHPLAQSAPSPRL